MVYSKVDNNCGDDSGDFIPYGGCLCCTGLPEKVLFRSKTILQTHIQYYPLPTVVVQNIVSTQAKQILSQIFTFTK